MAQPGPVSLPRPETTGEGYFDIAAALERLEAGRPLRFPPFELVHWNGLTFALNYRRDPVQDALRGGKFYETAELRALRRRVKPGARVLDVGANIGNHAVFFAAKMQAARVVVVEPNPLALAPLLANIVLNRLQGIVCTDLLGIAFSDASADGFTMPRHRNNLGATPLKRGDGTLTAHAGDDLLGDEVFDLIKIDVEGMELAVLNGLRQTIARSRPWLLVEVGDANLAAFRAFADEIGAKPVADWRVGPQNANYLLSAA